MSGEGGFFAVVRIRGTPDASRSVRDTLQMLLLTRVNHCVVVPKNANYEGMLMKARSYVTWGEIGRDTLEQLVKSRARLKGDERPDGKGIAEAVKALSEGRSLKGTGVKRVFRLRPPSKGYKAIRLPFPKGDAGYRGERMDGLIRRMI
jgi:large subunit ribosomal protein L30